MKMQVYTEAQLFEGKIGGFLLANEDVFSLFLGVLQGIKAGQYKDPLMATIEEEGKLLAFIQMTPPHPLNLVLVDESRQTDVIEFLITRLMALDVQVQSIISVKPWAYDLAHRWEVRTGQAYELLMDQGLYRLDRVNEQLEASPGNWRYATEADAPLIEKWYSQFEEDAGLAVSPVEVVRERVAYFLKEQEVFVWEHEGEVVSMMKKSRPTQHGITVSLVFTPKDKRQKGYARTLVAAVSTELLMTYDFCMLYTDMLNPTSNKIYQEIGYQKLVDSVHIGFVKAT